MQQSCPPDSNPTVNWLITLAPSAHSASMIAAQELRDYLRRAGLAAMVIEGGSHDDNSSIQAGGKIATSQVVHLEVDPVRALATAENGETGSGDGGAQTASEIIPDAFNIHHDSAGCICVVGSNPRSVLYGVYRLIDWLRDPRKCRLLNIQETAHFIERWMPATLHGRTDSTANIRYLTRLGANTTYLRGRRDAFAEVKHLTHYVRDDVHLPQISLAYPPHGQMLKMARRTYSLADEHGLNITMFQDEPIAIVGPTSKGPEIGDALPPSLLPDLPADAIGTASCLRYRNDGWNALSVFHPKVQAHYRQLLRGVLEMFPKLRTLYVYNEDAGSANVHPPTEPYTKDAYPPGYAGYPYAAHLQLANLLQEAGRGIRADFRVASVTYHWYQPDQVRRAMVAGLPAGSVLLTLAAWDDSMDTTTLPAWTEELCRQVRQRGDLVLLADDDFNGSSDDLLMEITAGFPCPHRTYRKCNAWAKAGVMGITQHHTGGPTLGINAIGDLAWREFTWRPMASAEQAETVILQLLERQLGSQTAAEKMLQACRYVDQALDAVEADLPNRPYCQRLHHSARIAFPPHLEQGLRRDGPTTSQYVGDGVDACAWAEMLRKELAAYSQASLHARKAVDLCSDSAQPFYQLYRPDPADQPADGGNDGRPAMSCRQYAFIAANAIDIVLCFNRMLLNFLDADLACDDAARLAVWRGEAENLQSLLGHLEHRRPWMQSPYGRRILDRYVGRIQHKIELLSQLGV
jgi:hypothetical protein